MVFYWTMGLVSGIYNNMLSGIRVFSSDLVWRQILSDLNAVVLDMPSATDINLDNVDIPMPISAQELKALLIRAGDNTDILNTVFGRPVSLSNLQSQVIATLYNTGGLSLSHLKSALGYAPDTSTHAVDTAIYQLRKMFGHEIIINDNGVYKLGRI